MGTKYDKLRPSHPDSPRNMAERMPASNPVDALHSPHFFIKVVRECEALGASVAQLLHGTAVEEQRLHDAGTRVTVRQTLRLAANALRLCGRPDLGLHLGSCTQANDGGLVSVTAAASGKFWQKARLNERFHRLSGQILVPGWREEGSLQVCRLQAPGDLGELLPFFVEESFSSLVSAMRANYRGGFTPIELRLAYDAPAHRGRYDALFGCPVRFNASHCELVGDFLALPAPRRAAHALNFRLCERLCEEMDQQAGIPDQVRTVLQQQDEALSMCEVAARLGMSSRTLARRLSAHGLAYQDVKDRLRLDKAAQLLRQTRLTVDAVAEATGFRSVRRFRDFFARHHGQSPSRYRRSSKGTP